MKKNSISSDLNQQQLSEVGLGETSRESSLEVHGEWYVGESAPPSPNTNIPVPTPSVNLGLFLGELPKPKVSARKSLKDAAAHMQAMHSPIKEKNTKAVRFSELPTNSSLELPFSLAFPRVDSPLATPASTPPTSTDDLSTLEAKIAKIKPFS